MRGQHSGYEIRKLFEDGPFATIQAVGFGSIYPALTALLRDGLVTVEEHSQDGKPDKKIYSITSDGQAAFMDALQSEPAIDKLKSDMLFMLSYGDLMGPGRVRALMNKYVAYFKQRLEEMAETDHHSCDYDNAGHEFVHGFGETIYQAAIDYIEQNRHILEDQDEYTNALPRAAAGGMQ